MPTSAIGLIAGLLLAIAAALGGFGYFLLGAVGWGVGAALDGKLDLAALTRGRGRG